MAARSERILQCLGCVAPVLEIPGQGSPIDNRGATLSPGPREPGPEGQQIYGLRRSEEDRPTDRSIARLRQRHGTMRLPAVR